MTISGKAKLAGVMGWPIGHSRSPRLHGYWLERYGIDGAYVPLAVPPDRIEQAIRALPALGFRGCNVTVPHKETAYRTVDRLDATARRMGAVNTIVVGEDGALEGRNTDGFGFIENLKSGAPGWKASDGPALVIGAGGAARAVVASLLDEGAPRVWLVNRTRARADELAADIGNSDGVGAIETADWVSRETLLEGVALVVNTTTQGMAGQPPLELDLRALPGSAVVTDIVYTPLMTPLLTAAQARGNRVVDGVGMLLHQARPGFAAWFGREPEVTEGLKAAVLQG
ncbi:shikimate dehydrogenase [Azospirillum brasilense]|uniref:Shikimate dehydrogenase (NADP(+)) n=1 Tax=Azospirillum brasilense TaxID=192 RepID=A0A0P0EJD3_AZOBR|nr:MULTISPECIES: shikimate dehydrogenase [Azospirillum]ALJ34000.1 shikimate dehydrogenase [Azospirillum brasilense]MDW7553038.1 shikimate dehydrogenase [Azospirillum brasilense]MDW7591770.1 shikimate dehydrogenase [Azospirillum brasilense]MDW7627953.1 shikimate dehydrogenase [Azospirillum brasilense]MDX5952578.1 shikimate dehydrogenase [Azospirillum brasilense]